MDLTSMIPGGAGEEKTPQQQLSKEEYAAYEKTAEGRSVGRGRRPGTGGVPKRGIPERISGFYGTVQYTENAQSFAALRTEPGGNGGKILCLLEGREPFSKIRGAWIYLYGQHGI